MTKIELSDRLHDLDFTHSKVRYAVDELANRCFTYTKITGRLNEFAHDYPRNLTTFEILVDYVTDLERQLCELRSGLAEGGIEA